MTTQSLFGGLSLVFRRCWPVCGLVLLASTLAADEVFDKDAFLSRKKWYANFTVRLKGIGQTNKPDKHDGYSKTEWNILREVSGVVEFGMAMPGQFPANHLAKDPKALMAAISSPPGRYIAWTIAPPMNFAANPASFVTGGGGGMYSSNPSSFIPVTYSVNDVITTETLSYGEAHSATKDSNVTHIQGGGTAYMNRTGMLTCDLSEMMLEFFLDGTRAAVGFKGEVANVKTHRVSQAYEQSLGKTEETDFPVTSAKPDSFLPAITEAMRQQLFWQKLVMREGKIVFTVTEPVTKFPFGIDREKKGGPPLELSMEVTLSPTPPSRAKLVLHAIGYDKWRPLCADTEDKKGNALPINWRVEEEGGDTAKPPKITRVVFSLLNTSHEPGVCMNYPVHPKMPADFDLKFQPSDSRRPGYGVSSDRQKLTLSDSQVGQGKGNIAVECFDAGATGTLVAEAELEDGRVLKATVEGSSGDTQLRIPDFEPGVSWIARSWRAQHAPGKKDDSDDEKDPVGDGQVGDGLTVWDEYRGFWVGGHWQEADPKTKDLFIINGIGEAAKNGLWMFASITGLRVHDQLVREESRADRVINFNFGDHPHPVNQHCLILIEGGENGPALTASICRAVDGVSFPGPPKNTQMVEILPSMLAMDFLDVQTRPGEVYSVVYADATICHELCHAIGIRHHGDKDQGARPWMYLPKTDGELVTYADGVAVKVWDEKGTLMEPARLFPGKNAGDVRPVWIGEQHGQHGGEEACVMRYDNAQAYRSQFDPHVIYYHGGPEIIGNRLCTSPAGTGVNIPTHTPQSRYFGADADRGDCAHKFVISDRWEKIH